MVRVFRRRELLLVTAVARRRHRIEIAESAVLMAGVAGRCRMGSGQREPVHVLIDLLDRNFPTPHGVTVFASRAHLSAVNIGMAVRAFVSDIRKNQLGVTGRTGNPFVHAPQRELGPIVIEFRRAADRLPAVNRMAVLTGQIQRPVRAARVLRSLRRRASSRRREQEQPHQQRFSDQSWDQAVPHTFQFPQALLCGAPNDVCTTKQLNVQEA